MSNLANGLRHAQDPLGQLPHAADAPFNSYAKQHERPCLPDTRVGLLHEIYSWADGLDERCIFWLSGMAGTGKSTIARTVARSYFDEGRLAASFFFSRGGGDVSHATMFVTSIAKQLAHNVPASRQYISDAIAERGDIVSQSLRDQWQHLVCRPLSRLREPGPYVLVVDALDECDNNKHIRMIVQLLAEARSLLKVQLRVFVTSRPEVPIRHGFGQIADTQHKEFVLHNISLSTVNRDIATFLKHHLRIIAKDLYHHADWPGAEIIMRLVHSASGLFIWAATACRFIEEGGQLASDRLRAILKDSSCTDDSPNDKSSSEDSCTDSHFVVSPEEQLDSIYLTVLSSPVRRYTKQERKKWYRLIRETLGAIVLLDSPLPASSLAGLLCIPVEDVQRTLYELHSILDVPQDPTRLVRLHHPSFRDFLLDRRRCIDDHFWVDEKSTNKILASRCLELMSGPSGLHQNMCNLSGPGVLRSDIDEGTVAGSLSPDLQYACRYWVNHLKQSQQDIADGDMTHLFLHKHLLHWLEVMSLMRELSRCVHLLNNLRALAGVCSSQNTF